MDAYRKAPSFEQGQPREDARDRPAGGRHQLVHRGSPEHELPSEPRLRQRRRPRAWPPPGSTRRARRGGPRARDRRSAAGCPPRSGPRRGTRAGRRGSRPRPGRRSRRGRGSSASLLERPRRVISAPLRAGASTTTVASASPLMIRLRRGKVPGSARCPGRARTRRRRRPRRSRPPAAAWARGWMSAWPEPMTATVVPRAWSAAACAAPSIPTARPDTTLAPTATRSPAIRAAMARPASVGRRVPTIATAALEPSAAGSPRRYSTCGGISIAASRLG